MSLIAKLLISLAVAAGATVLTVFLADGPLQVYAQFAAFAAATVITAVLVTLPGRPTATSAPAQQANRPPAQPAGRKSPQAPNRDSASDSARETGQVKWFNVSKGFGFITKDDGEEIFVHFRSIRGEGRRGLRNGQRVSFVVAESDKGPQAEDVEGLE